MTILAGLAVTDEWLACCGLRDGDNRPLVSLSLTASRCLKFHQCSVA